MLNAMALVEANPMRHQRARLRMDWDGIYDWLERVQLANSV